MTFPVETDPNTNQISINYLQWKEAAEKSAKGIPLEKIKRPALKGGLPWEILYTKEMATNDWANQQKTQSVLNSSLPEFAEPLLIQHYNLAAYHSGAGQRTTNTESPKKEILTRLQAQILGDLEGGSAGFALHSSGFFPFDSKPFDLYSLRKEDWQHALEGVRLDLISIELPLDMRFEDLVHSLPAVPNHATARADFPFSSAVSSKLIPYFREIEIFAKLHSDASILFPVSAFQARGADMTTELALMLAFADECCRKVQEPQSFFEKNFKVRLGINSALLGSIAKIRAAQKLWQKFTHEKFGPIFKSTPLRLCAETSACELSRFDTWSNIIRSSAQCAAALMAGCHEVSIYPHDIRIATENHFSRRIARNVFHVLAQESHLAKFYDPWKGAFCIEAQTGLLCEKSWNCYQEILNQGGFIKAIENGFIPRLLSESRTQLLKEESFRKPGTIGVSDYPNQNETKDLENHEEKQSLLRQHAPDSFDFKTACVEWQKPLFISDLFGSLRDLVQKNWRTATQNVNFEYVQIAVGPRAATSARLSWTENTIGTLGLSASTYYFEETEILDSLESESSPHIEAFRAHIRHVQSPLWVIVATDPFYKEHLENFLKLIIRLPEPQKQNTCQKVLVAGKLTPELSVALSQITSTDPIFIGSNIYETLRLSLEQLGMKNS